MARNARSSYVPRGRRFSVLGSVTKHSGEGLMFRAAHISGNLVTKGNVYSGRPMVFSITYMTP